MNTGMETCQTCGATLPSGAEHCLKCRAPVVHPEVIQAPVTSITKSGPYQFGLIGKLVWTSLFLLVGFGLYAGAVTAGRYVGTPGLALVLMLLGLYVVVGLIFLWGVWRPTRVK